NGQRDTKRHDHEIVEIPDDRDEIGNQIDRTQSISGSRGRDDFRIPGNTRISSRDPDGDRITFDVSRPLLQSIEHDSFGRFLTNMVAPATIHWCRGSPRSRYGLWHHDCSAKADAGDAVGAVRRRSHGRSVRHLLADAAPFRLLE